MIFGRYAAGFCLTAALLGGMALASPALAADAQAQPPQADAQRSRDAYAAVRRQILALTPGPAFAGQPVYGAVMEFSTATETVMVIAFPTGDVRLYRSVGGGIIGRSENAALGDAARAFVTASVQAAPRLVAPTGYPSPAPGEIRFYILTPDGVRTGMGSRATLTTGENPLTPLYTAANALVAQLRAYEASQVGSGS